MNQDVSTILESSAASHGDLPAIIESAGGRDRSITYAELDAAATRFASCLGGRGIGPGSRVLMLLPVSIALYRSLLGILRAGATAVFIDPGAGSKFAICTKLAAANAVVCGWRGRMLRLLKAPLRSIPLVVGPNGRGRSDWKAPSIDPASPALLTFTSGSTGRPKLAARSHAFLIAQHQALSLAIDLQPGQRDLSTLPVFVLANLASGVTSILADGDLRRPGFVDPSKIAHQITRLAPDRTAGSPAFYQRLLSHDPRMFSAFRRIDTGGGPVFPSLLQELHRAAPQANVVAVYGSTEAEPIADVPFSEITAEDFHRMANGAGLLAGKPVEGIACRIIAFRDGQPLGRMEQAAFERLCVHQGEAGEIVVSGKHVMSGYVDGIGDHETKFRVHDQVWHRTGDTGTIDEAGRLWLLGRSSARVKDSRGVLFPFAVECVARSIHGIHAAACIGRDGIRILLVEWKKPPTASQRQALAKAIDSFGIDRVTEAAIPMDTRHNAKIDYSRLKV